VGLKAAANQSNSGILATLAADLGVMRNIVHFDKIPKYNAVNTLCGYAHIGIYSPLEVIDYENS